MRRPKQYTDQEVENGFAGTCPICNRIVGVRIPRAKFASGDGTVRVCWVHKDGEGNRCAGSGRPAKEWS